MKKIFFFIGMLGAFSVISLNVNAQATSNHNLTMGIPEVCLITTPATAISLELVAAAAGASIAGGTGFGYTQISSIVSASELRTISAAVTGVPAGTSLKVTTEVPGLPNVSYAGVMGTGSTDVNLVNGAAAATLVTGIGSCYTGTAADDGYKLNYSWNAGDPGNYGNIVAIVGSNAVVVLTITNQ